MNRPILLILALYFPVVGCSTKAPSDSFHIIISTNPPGANLTICNQSSKLCVSNAKTPSKLILYRSREISWPASYSVLCTKEGFVDVARTLHFGVDGWYLLIVDEASSETLEVREVDGYRIELELPRSETIEIPSGDELTRMNSNMVTKDYNRIREL